MSDVQALGGGNTQSPPYTTSPVASVAMPAGTPVYKLSTGQVAPARANSFLTSTIIGILRAPAQAGSAVDVQWGGSLGLTDEQWQSVLGTSSGGLTTGAPYYLSDAVAGQITSTPPITENHYVVQIGVAEFTGSVFLQLGPPIAVGSF